MICICGKKLKKASTGRTRLYCSDRCRQRAHRNVTKQTCNNVTKLKSEFFFSGIEKAATAHVLVKEKASGMMSQLLYRDALLARCGSIPLVMDSGAYTKVLSKKDIEIYASLISRLGTRCLWYANADVIGDQEKSNENYAYLRSLLPEVLHTRILWIYQVGAPLSYLHRAVQEHTQIGIGGLVPLFQSPDKTIAYQKIREVAAIVAHAQVNPHYFGVSIPQVIQELHAYHRVFSVDSTTWLIGGKYGLLVARNGRQQSGRELGYDFTTEERLAQNVRTMKRWMERPESCEILLSATQMSWLEVAS